MTDKIIRCKDWERLVNEIDALKVIDAPKDVELLPSKEQAFYAGQMNMLLRLLGLIRQPKHEEEK